MMESLRQGSSNRIRVLHALHSLGLGGTEKTAQFFASRLNRDRFHAAVFAFEDGPRALEKPGHLRLTALRIGQSQAQRLLCLYPLGDVLEDDGKLA